MHFICEKNISGKKKCVQKKCISVFVEIKKNNMTSYRLLPMQNLFSTVTDGFRQRIIR